MYTYTSTHIHTHSKRFNLPGQGRARFTGWVNKFIPAVECKNGKDLYVVRYEDSEEEEFEVSGANAE